MRLEPTGNRIVVRPVGVEEVTEGGIFIPQNANHEAPVIGDVIAIGPLTEDVFTGAEVLYGKYAGTEVEVDHETLLVMRDTDVLAVIRR